VIGHSSGSHEEIKHRCYNLLKLSIGSPVRALWFSTRVMVLQNKLYVIFSRTNPTHYVSKLFHPIQPTAVCINKMSP